MGGASSKVLFQGIVNQLLTHDIDPMDHDVSPTSVKSPRADYWLVKEREFLLTLMYTFFSQFANSSGTTSGKPL
jgi:hypothetical protein